MKNFTITLDGTNRHFSIALNATTRRFTIRPGVGPQGPAGTNGSAATVTVGTTTTGNAGTNASVTNSGTTSAAVFNFTIPRGDTGAAGPNTVTSATTTNFTTGQVLYANGSNVGSLSRSGIDTRRYFPDDAPLILDSTPTPEIRIIVPNIDGGHGTIDQFWQYSNLSNNRPSWSFSLVTSGVYTGSLAFDGTDWTLSISFDGTPVYFARMTEAANPSVATRIPWDAMTLDGATWDDVSNGDSPQFPDAPQLGETVQVNGSLYAYNGNGYVSIGTTPFVVSSSQSAVSGQQYLVVATSTISDPSPTQGAWFRVIVRNGTATVGGTAYATSGTIIERSYHSGAWANRVYNETPVLGSSVSTALSTAVGSAGAFVVNGGALGTPSSGTLTSCTGLPISTGVSGLGANVATFLATPSSANLRSALTDPTGTGSNVHANSPTITSPTINTGIAGSAVPSILQNQAGSTRPICILFEDFPGLSGAGTHPWNDSGTGSTDAMATGGAGQFMGTCRLVTGTTSGNSRSRSLGIATSTVFIGAIVRYGFAIPDITSVVVGVGFAGGGSTCQLLYASANNSGQWTLITNAGVTTFTTEVAQAGNYFSGKRYQVEIERVSATQTRILLEIADFNLANWSTVFSGTITHSSVSANWGECTPSFNVTTQTNAARTLIVDWASLYLPMILR